MIQRVARDESGMTMALAVIMTVVIGVMGAGLLTFVQRDLDTVIEVNRGQRAFEMADAGVQLAKQHIERDPHPAHYDLDDALTNPAYNLICDIVGSNPLALDETPASPADPGLPYIDGNWSLEDGGNTTTDLDGNPSTNDSVTVTIQWLNPAAPPESGCKAPVSSPPPGTYFFEVISTGKYNGTKRTIEAVYRLYDIGVTKGFYTTSTVHVSNNTTITDTSIFSRSTSESQVGSGVDFVGFDRAYGNWATYPNNILDPLDDTPNPFNSTPRCLTDPGIGTLGSLSKPPLPGRDYDGIPRTTLCRPTPHKFEYPRSGNNITFPFNPDALPTLAELEAAARAQGDSHYIEIDHGGSPSLTFWPPEIPGRTTIVYVKFTGSPENLKWGVPQSGPILPPPNPDDCRGPVSKGILVVDNGNFQTAQNMALFRGVVIVRGGTVENGNRDGQYTDTGGSTCLEGFAIADDLIKIGGNVGAGNILSVLDLYSEAPGFFDVKLWSWRECYTTTCT